MERVEPPAKFSKSRGLESVSIFRGVLLEKRGWLFHGEGGGEGCNFYIKNKLKSEIFNNKKQKTFINKNVITKNLKETRTFIKKVTFEPLMDFKQNHCGSVGNITKAATFKSFFHSSYKNTQWLLLWQCFFFIMRQTLTDDFSGLHKNMHCVLPLNSENCN